MGQPPGPFVGSLAAHTKSTRHPRPGSQSWPSELQACPTFSVVQGGWPVGPSVLGPHKGAPQVWYQLRATGPESAQARKVQATRPLVSQLHWLQRSVEGKDAPAG